MISVRFIPEERTYSAEAPAELFLAAASCDIWLEQPCGSKTVCGKCKVRVREGAPAPTAADCNLLAPDELAQGWRLGCQLVLDRPAVVEIPAITRSVAAKTFGDPEMFSGKGFVPAAQWNKDAPYGAAVDLGSTTLAAALVDLRTGAVLATQSRLNPQVKYGGDIISRIFFAQEHADGGERLHRELIQAVSAILGELAAQAGIETSRIWALTFAGNSTMMHSAAGADITPLGQAPYLGLWTEEKTFQPQELNLPVHERAIVRFLPMIRSHVGADTVAGILASGIDQSDGWRLLIDLGTNSEVVLGCRKCMVATSTAAGPAFEGANIYQGMRAAPGAIDAVRVAPDGRVVVKTVANEPPIGLCGSGLIDAAAEFCRARLIAPSGYMPGRQELAGVPEPLAGHAIVLNDGQRAIRLADKVVLTAQDVRQLQLIKGSIYAGIEILLQHFGLTVNDLEEVNVAGAFGNFVRKTSAQAIGLVPRIDPERVRFIGNAAGAGARMVLVDEAARERALRIAGTCEYVELAGHPGYADAFCAAIPFPPVDEHRPLGL